MIFALFSSVIITCPTVITHSICSSCVIECTRRKKTCCFLGRILLCSQQSPSIILLIVEIYETLDIDVKTPYGFEYSSVILSCDVSPLSAASYIEIIGWLEKLNDDDDDQIHQLELRKLKTKKRKAKQNKRKSVVQILEQNTIYYQIEI